MDFNAVIYKYKCNFFATASIPVAVEFAFKKLIVGK